ncbi:PilZ domain-containing protein [Desulfomarina sp.]
MAEKRRFTRIVFAVRAECTVAGKTFSVERLINLSVGGCLVEIKAEAAIDDECDVVIPLGAEGLHVNVKGRVARIEDDYIGIKFVSIDPESLHHLQNIIKYNSPDAEAIEDELKDHPGLL